MGPDPMIKTLDGLGVKIYAPFYTVIASRRRSNPPRIFPVVILAQARIHRGRPFNNCLLCWIPAFAGMTVQTAND
jgi:hypothetical protein